MLLLSRAQRDQIKDHNLIDLDRSTDYLDLIWLFFILESIRYSLFQVGKATYTKVQAQDQIKDFVSEILIYMSHAARPTRNAYVAF